MKKRLFAPAGACWLIAAAGVLGTAHAQDAADPLHALVRIAAGSHYLQTAPGTEATLPINNKMIKVKLTGVPIQRSASLGNTDTIIERTQDAVFSTAADAEPDVSVTIPITLTGLSLTGTVPGNPGSCTVNITLAFTPASTGTLTLTKTSNTGGTYKSTVSVYYVESFIPIGTGSVCYPTISPTTPCTFTQRKGLWSITPLTGEYEVVGPYGDVQANVHTALPPGYADFYITQLQTDSAATAKHVTCEAFAAQNTPCP